MFKKNNEQNSALDTVRNVAIIGSLLVLVLGGIALFPGIWDFIGERTGDPALERVDFETLTPPESMDHFLVCPLDICLDSEPDIVPGYYAVSVSELRAYFLNYIDNQPTVRLQDADPAANQFTYLEREVTQQFPDVITVKFLNRGEGLSSIALYSRTILGDNEEGRNRERVEEWLSVLENLR